MSRQPFEFSSFKTDAAELSVPQNTYSEERGSTPDISALSDKPSGVNPCSGINENVIREVEWRLV
ncbi:MAG: hypothetical protein FWE67_12295 [Planctomycetaceae bacterium]|nr:hypothetical protein [Planctomycetaceae bacterium]